MTVDGFFYWLIAAVVATPIVLIVKGLAAGKREETHNLSAVAPHISRGLAAGKREETHKSSDRGVD